MNEQVQEIFVEDIIPNRFQPRLTFDEKALQELSDSIKVHGVIQPLVLRRVGNKYEIIAGERRYKASCMAGLKKVPAVVREMSDNESAEVALIENVQRKNLSSIEEAQSYRNLLDRGYLTQEELAQKIGISQPTIANKMRLLNLCDEVQNALLNEQISERHARSLLSLTNPDDQKMMLNRIIKERLTVKQLDNEIKKYLQGGSQENNSGSTASGENGGSAMVPNNEENNTTETQGQEQQILSTNKNIFGFSVEPPTDLETSAPNLSIGSEGELDTSLAFNPFGGPVSSDLGGAPGGLEGFAMGATSNDASTQTESIETFDMFGDIVTPDNGNSNGPIDPFGASGNNQESTGQSHNIGDQITRVRNIVKDVEQDGFRVEMEEYDFEDLYQMIIKIKK